MKIESIKKETPYNYDVPINFYLLSFVISLLTLVFPTNSIFEIRQNIHEIDIVVVR